MDKDAGAVGAVAVVGQDVKVLEELRALAAEVRQDVEPQELELKELDVLIKQTAAEVDRLTALRNETAKRLREVEVNLEHFARSDIARSYAESAEAQMRLFMMQSRLEQLEYKRQTLERNRRNLLRFVALASQLPADSEVAEDEVVSPREIVSRVVQAEEDERQRCAQAIHDGAAQTLANLVLRMQLCQRLLDTDEPRARRELSDLQEALAIALQRARQLIYDLRPLTLEELGLQTTIQKYVQVIADRAEVPIELRMSRFEERLDTAVEAALYRLVEEALGNALRHAQASKIRVTVGFEDTTFRATVEDDGVGFDPPATIRAARQNRHLGLASMLERAALLGGSVTFDSSRGKGTRVHVEVPLPRERAASA